MTTANSNSPIRVVYDTQELIPDDHTIGYVTHIIPQCAVSADQQAFHEQLATLTTANNGRLPHALLQRYGLDPLTTYCTNNDSIEENIQLCEVMRNAVKCMVDDRMHDNLIIGKVA